MHKLTDVESVFCSSASGDANLEMNKLHFKCSLFISRLASHLTTTYNIVIWYLTGQFWMTVHSVQNDATRWTTKEFRYLSLTTSSLHFSSDIGSSSKGLLGK